MYIPINRTRISKYSSILPVLRGPLNLGLFIGQSGIIPLWVRESPIKWLRKPIEKTIADNLSNSPRTKPKNKNITRDHKLCSAFLCNFLIFMSISGIKIPAKANKDR